MHDMKAAQSVNAGEQNSPMDPIEQAARASERAASEFAEGASRAKDIAATASDQAMRAGVELMQSNAETIQHTLQCGARLAARITERAAGQFGRAIGVSEEGAEEAAQKSSRNLEAIVQSGAALSEITRRVCDEWADMARVHMERGFDRIEAFRQCRTPQDFIALQSELIRDNMETFLACVRKAGEHSAYLAAQARPQFGDVTAGRRAA
jgi:hypothetical protein